MRIGMVLDKIYPTDIRVEYEARSLSRSGHDVTIFSYSDKNRASTEILDYARIVRLPINKFLARKFKQILPTLPIFARIWHKPLSQALRTNPVDALHAHDLYMVPVCLYLLEKMSTSIPIVADLHENYPAALDMYSFANTFPGNILISKPAWMNKELEWLQKTKKIIVVVEESKQYYTKRGINYNKIHIVPNYVNLEQFYQPAEILQPPETENVLPRGDINLLYIGAINYHRGLQEVIQALAHPKLDKYNIKLWIVGDGSYLHQLQMLTNDLGMENVHFFGRKPPTELPMFISMSDICLIPHFKSLHTDTTIPHKLTQYMAFKKPLLTSDCNPIKRIIQEVKCGYTYNSGDINNLVDQILLLISKRREWTVMGERAYDAVRNSYNWRISATNLIEMYKGVTSHE